MLPPVDPKVLKRNPNFEVLYKDLCTRKLNPDGSTRDTKKQRMQEEIRRNLTALRTALHSTSLLTHLLSTLPSHSSPSLLPSSLHPLIDLATAHLTSTLSASDRAALAPDTHLFHAHLPTIALALSARLAALAALLCTICAPLSPPPPALLPQHASALLSSATQTLPAALADAQSTLAASAHSVIISTHDVLACGIRVLEQTQHGALARGARARAERLGARAEALGLRARVYTATQVMPEEFVAALKEWKKGQGVGEKRLREREGLARRALELYGKAGERGMRDLARRKGEVVREMERVEGEIRRLEKGE